MTSRLYRFIGIFSLAMLAVAFGANAQAATLLQQVQQRGSLNIGMEGTYPPFSYVNDNNKLVGFEVDFGRALAKQMGVKPNFLLNKWDGLLAGLQTGRFDVVINQVTITPARKKAIAFTQPYSYSGMQIITRKALKHKFSGPQSLDGVTVGVGLGSNHEQWLKKHVPGAKIQTYQSNASKMQDLRVGRIDAIVNDRLMVSYMLKKTGGSVVGAGHPFATEKSGVALQKGHPALLKALNNAIDALRKSGKLAKISQKWFGLNVTTNPDNSTQ